MGAPWAGGRGRLGVVNLDSSVDKVNGPELEAPLLEEGQYNKDLHAG